MPTLYVREVPEKVYGEVQRIAQEQGRSLNAYVITLLEQAIDEEKRRRQSAEALERILRRRRLLPPGAPDSVEMIRRMRDANE
jgi:hypothetical protein